MDINVMFQFTGQTFILMGLAITYAIFKNESFIHPIFRKLLMGVFVAFTVTYVMYFNIHLDGSDDFFFDVRSLALGLSGMFLGLIPTVMGLITASIIRIFEGGAGTILGITEAVIGASIGLTWRYLRLKKVNQHNYKISWVEIYGVGLLMQAIILSLVLFLPTELRNQIFEMMVFPQLILFPIGFYLVAQFLIIQRRQYFNDVEVLKSEKQFKNLFNKNKSILMLIDPVSNKIVDVNDRAIEIYGYTKEEFRSLEIGELNTLSQPEILEKIELAKSNESSLFNFQHIKKNGEIFDVEVSTGPITLENKEYLYSSITDVTEKKLSQRMFKDADERLRLTLLSVAEGIIVTDEYARISLINDKAKQLVGTNDTVLRKLVYEEYRIYSNHNEKSFEQIYSDCIKKNQTFKSDYTYSLLNNKNEPLFIDFTLSPVEDEYGINHGAILVIRDVTIEKKRQEEMRFISQHDFLTKLYNRYNFEQEFKRINVERQHPISLIIGDVNALKLVNDAFGHLEGDKLLQEIANIFRKAVRSEDIVARWGGDEFAVLLPQTSADDAQKVLDRINDLTEKSFYKTITPSIAIGISTKLSVDKSIKDTLTDAEEAMYNNKAEHGPRFRRNLVEHLTTILNKKIDGHNVHTTSIEALINQYAKFYGLPKQELDDLLLYAKYHDIGRVTLQDELINKRSNYTDTELLKIQGHPEIGSRLVATIPEMQHLAIPILHHHEWFNGKGYPNSLRGEDIHHHARLFAVIDAYESMTGKRSYRSSKTHTEAIKELQKFSNKQFDPQFVEKFIKMIKEG